MNHVEQLQPRPLAGRQIALPENDHLRRATPGQRPGLKRLLCALQLLSFAAFAVSAATLALAAPVATFDDVTFWTGVGANRAAIAIDWTSASSTDAALVWGYRWDGAADGEDMLRAVLAADSRLFAKISEPGPLGISVWGIGYDADDDGGFALSDGTEFDADGVAVTGLPDEDATPLDPDDWYREGWFTGVWSYTLANADPWSGDDWTESQLGPSFRPLVDGAWDSWAFASPIVLGAFAQNPVAAEPPANETSADFDGDGNVDGGDFLTWQRGLGLTAGAERVDGDANGDFAVDALDLEVWKSGFGVAATGGSGVAASMAIPEPPGSVHAAFVVLLFFKRHLTTRNFS
ncbi:MAG: hypothetical protein H0T51_10105 [Pirellulales bacterium]|nr:hypothetical protein [Pirellulales bacterium]